ncbi:hypothetical protein AVEN_186410-1 [Araneus ventricosus]|uniref:Uncharacterized protein n=1 Tax=Araneus ventricosus TaxID=182803 RepID=A0A4Y2D2C3_ARAVE|nr:hypothetical protein AVEN_186410-1 [Araneus ventricosus]
MLNKKLEILQKLDNGESASTDADDVLNEENKISHSAALQSVETLLDYMGQRGFDYDDITAAFTVLEELLLSHGICIAVKERLTKDSGVAGELQYDNIVKRIMAKPNAKGKT